VPLYISCAQVYVPPIINRYYNCYVLVLEVIENREMLTSYGETAIYLHYA
jgi:hypothetical protein